MNHELLVKKRNHSFYINNISYAFDLYRKIDSLFPNKDNNDFKLYFFDLEHFIKSDESFSRSIIRNLRNKSKRYYDLLEAEALVEFDKDYNDEMKVFSDFVRMNFCIKDDKRFEQIAIFILKTIMGIQNMSTNWKKSKPFNDSFLSVTGCRDLKIFLLYNNIIPFEIQLHNVSSENMNLCTHGIYEVYRSPSISNDFHELIGIDRKNLYQKYVAKPTYDLKRLLKEGINYV